MYNAVYISYPHWFYSREHTNVASKMNSLENNIPSFLHQEKHGNGILQLESACPPYLYLAEILWNIWIFQLGSVSKCFLCLLSIKMWQQKKTCITTYMLSSPKENMRVEATMYYNIHVTMIPDRNCSMNFVRTHACCTQTHAITARFLCVFSRNRAKRRQFAREIWLQSHFSAGMAKSMRTFGKKGSRC